MNALHLTDRPDLEHCLDAYVVVAGTGEIITVGHRDRRIRRH